MSLIEIFTDGSAKGNPGNGGYGVYLRFHNVVKELSAGYRLTTNNRMELLSVIVALESLKSDKYPVRIVSDSKYVIDSINLGWVQSWVKKGFKGKKNEDLWRRYLSVAPRYNVEYVWVKGHNGHFENERCDQLAVQAAESNDLLIDEVYERIKS
jgi:ribonuclease HI